MVSANAIGSGYESEFFNLLNLELGQAFSQNLIINSAHPDRPTSFAINPTFHLRSNANNMRSLVSAIFALPGGSKP